MYINNNFSSPNYSPRTKKIEYIILHYTEMPFEDALSKLTDSKSGVSSHYLIKEDGEIFGLVADDRIAWHAGESSWRDSAQLNQNSLGIEMDNIGSSEFSANQMRSCIKLCHYLVGKYNINPANIIGHSDIAPMRKIDPGIFFDWQLLAKNGLGMWYYGTESSAEDSCQLDQTPLIVEQLQQNLRKLGYKIDITGQMDTQTNYVIRAFQSHFCQNIIKNKGGIDFYKNLSSVYDWDSHSNKILQQLLSPSAKRGIRLE